MTRSDDDSAARLFQQAQSPDELHLLHLRYEELLALKAAIPGNSRLLEIGTGNGFQANVLKSWGHDVASVDVQDPGYQSRFFHATYYDGVHLPFADETFDVVFSSNCLEHVRELPATLAETARVLRRNGVVIHLIPSVSWRLYTLVTHILMMPKLVRRKLTAKGDTRAGGPDPHAAGQRAHSLLFRALGLPAHGEFRSSVHELWFYRRQHWINAFRASGFEVIRVEYSPLFYTGNMLAKSLSMRVRRRLVNLLGAACNAYYLKKPGG